MQALAKRFQKLFQIPEWILLRQAKLGDREAFGTLYKHYLNNIYRYVFFRVNQENALAEDITADVFVKAWEKLKQFKEGSFQAWLYTIARNTLIDYFRSQPNSEPIQETIIDEKENIEERVHTTLEVQRVRQAMQHLTSEQQEVLILKFTHDVSNQEIATILGKHEDAIRALQSRGIKELRRLLVIHGEKGE